MNVDPDWSVARVAVTTLMIRAGVRLPVEIATWEGGLANACLWGFGARRCIAVSWGLLAILGTAELCAIVAHELGHYCLRHQRRLALHVGAQASALVAGLAMLTTGSELAFIAFIASGLIGFYYHRLVLDMDFQADAWACKFCDPRDLKSALHKIAVANGCAPPRRRIAELGL